MGGSAPRSGCRLVALLVLVAACGKTEGAPLSFDADSGAGGGSVATGGRTGGAAGADGPAGAGSLAGADGPADAGSLAGAGGAPGIAAGPGIGGASGGSSVAGATSAGAAGSYGGVNDRGCRTDEHRCGPDGRESCQSGSWQSEPCPLDAPSCQSGACIVRGPKLVKITDFYIESTEVTVAQYSEFLAAVQDTPPEQEPYCSWNTSLSHGEASATGGNPDMPMGSVDWCDAASYCKWADEHLCGNIDRRAKLTQKDFADPLVSQWFLSCGGPSGAMHPSISTCNPGIKPVATSACEGSYPGVFDLEGNVAEWIDGCRDVDGANGLVDECFAQGGAALQQASCAVVTSGFARGSSNFEWIGFRCCSG